MVTYLRKHKHPCTAATFPAQGNWAKEQKELPCLLNPKLGKYQQLPTKATIKDLNAVSSHSVKKYKPVVEHNVHIYKRAEYSKISVVFAAANFRHMTNFGNICWFTAAMQVFV